MLVGEWPHCEVGQHDDADRHAFAHQGRYAEQRLEAGNLLPGLERVTRDRHERPGYGPSGQIELVNTFADQAMIAIENVRLFEAEQQRTHELTESLEKQTATSEVLRVISASPGVLQPAFEAMLANATRIYGAQFSNLLLRDANSFRVGATHGAPPAYVVSIAKRRFASIPPGAQPDARGQADLPGR